MNFSPIDIYAGAARCSDKVISSGQKIIVSRSIRRVIFIFDWVNRYKNAAIANNQSYSVASRQKGVGMKYVMNDLRKKGFRQHPIRRCALLMFLVPFIPVACLGDSLGGNGIGLKRGEAYGPARERLNAHGWHELLTMTSNVKIWRKKGVELAVELQQAQTGDKSNPYVIVSVRCRKNYAPPAQATPDQPK